MDLRQQRRHQGIIPLKVMVIAGSGAAETILAHTSDISPSGCRIVLSNPLEVGAGVRIHYKHTRLDCKVMWCRSLQNRKYEAGLRMLKSAPLFWGEGLENRDAFPEKEQRKERGPGYGPSEVKDNQSARVLWGHLETRRQRRHLGIIPVKILTGEVNGPQKTHLAHTKDISPSGCHVIVDSYLEVGSEVRINYRFRNHPFRVMWCRALGKHREGFEAGLQMLKVAPMFWGEGLEKRGKAQLGEEQAGEIDLGDSLQV